MKSIKEDLLFINYLKFMELFRGAVERHETFARVSSDKKEFTFVVPYTEKKCKELAELDSTPTILTPYNLPSEKSKWKLVGSVTFMTMDSQTSQTSMEAAPGMSLISGNEKKISEDFSAAQCAGFLETPEAHAGWAKWLSEANHKNIGNKDVTYYVSHISTYPAAGAIAVTSESCVGIYGVATKPENRKMGLSTSILNKICGDFTDLKTIGLQVETDSYAHSYYRKLGFKEIYVLKRHVRK